MYIIIKKNLLNTTFVGSQTPSVHPDINQAWDEAMRLAQRNPGWEFIVCKFVEGVHTQSMFERKAYP